MDQLEGQIAMKIAPPRRPATGQGAALPQTRQTLWRLTLLCGVVLLIVVIGYSIRSIMRAMHGADQPEAMVVAPVTREQAAAPATPSSREAMPAEAAPPTVPTLREVGTVPPAFDGTSDVSKEFEIMRQREEGQKETIRIIKKEARENPDANNPSEEQLEEMEQSGALVM